MLYPMCALIQKQTIAVVEGVTLVATVTLNVLQDGEPYDSLLECSRQLHGEEPWGRYARYHGDATLDSPKSLTPSCVDFLSVC